MGGTRQRLFRAAVIVGSLAALWAIGVMWTGGGIVQISGVRFSSRAVRNPLAVALAGVVAAFLLAPAGQRRQALTAECGWLLGSIPRPRWLDAIREPARLIAASAAVTTVIVGLTEGAFIVGGADSYGYVSQAHLWTIGTLRQRPVLAASLPPDISLEAMSPLGYRPSSDGVTIAPTYSPGLPIVMAPFEILFGRESVFWVVPLLGGVLVWVSYLLGRRVHGPVAGAVAAVLVATSPPVLFELTMAPMSDLPAAAWWTLALLLVSLDRRDSALAAGLATGLAILTRPNLAPMAAVVGVLLLWRLVAARRPWSLVAQHALLFGVVVLSACAAVGAMNRVLWGSALMSGYGALGDGLGYHTKNIWPNLILYPRMVVTEMPAVLLLPIAALVRRRRGDRSTGNNRIMTVALWSSVVVVALMYVAYPAFDSEWNLRFLLPLVSPLMVLVSIAAVSLADRLTEARRAACIVAMLVVVGGYGLHYARNVGAFNTGHLRRFADIGDYIARQLPERAVLLSMLHSGSATYYTGRPTLRWDLLPPTRLDSLAGELTQRGYVPYLLLDADERADFQSRYRGHSRLAALDWPPLVSLTPVEVQLFAIPALP